MDTNDLEARLAQAVEAVEQMCRIVESMEKLVQVLMQERDAAIAYIQASDVINRAKL